MRRFTPKKKAKNGAKNTPKKANSNGAIDDDDNAGVDDDNDDANNANNDANSLRKIVISTDIDTDEEIMNGNIGTSEKNNGDMAIAMDANHDCEDKKNKVDTQNTDDNNVQRQPSTGADYIADNIADKKIDKITDISDQNSSKQKIASSNGLVRE